MFALTAGLLLVGCTWVQAANISPEEAQKQTEFKKAYGAARDAAEREKSLQLLEGLTHPSTVSLLLAVLNSDQEKVVRSEAFRVLSKFPAHDMSLAQTMVNIFNAVKPSDLDTKIEYARLMGNSEFKVIILDALADFGSKLRYPDFYNTNNSNTGGNTTPGVGSSTNNADPNQGIKKQRTQFEAFLNAFNSLSKAGLNAQDKSAPLEVKKWWEQNRAKMVVADKEIADKYKAADDAARDRDNPLVPKKADHKDEKKG